MKNFDEEQLQILNSNANRELVSAGAGSGKTTVMIEKIANIILKNKLPVENVLVVTFTVLAANEMKERLIARFQEELLIAEESQKQYLLNLIEQTKTASIDTIDGFSSKTIKKYFYQLNINPNFEIISEATRDYYLNRTMKKTIKDFSQDGDKINVLLDLFGGKARNLKNLQDIILKIYFKIINIEDYDLFLDQCINEYVNNKKCEEIVEEKIVYEAKKLKQALIENYVLEFKDRFEKPLLELENINASSSLKEILKSLLKIEMPKFTPKEKKANNLDALLSATKSFELFVEDLNKNGIDENFAENNTKIVEYFKYFVEMLKIFINNFNNLKKKNNLIDFNDLNRLMLKLLQNPEVEKELQNKYTYIFVDEYQDVNLLQDALIKKLVADNTKLFTVGDVKQSIYGFRGASPEWFLKQYQDYQQQQTGKVFKMNVNFRTNPLILHFVNEVFSRLMDKQSGDIDYALDCMFKPKRDDIKDQKVKIILARKNETDAVVPTGVYSVKNHKAAGNIFTNDYHEAMLVVQEIFNVVGKEFYDANLKEKRLLKFSDIAILVREERGEAFSTLTNLLNLADIPININNKLDINSSEGIKLIISILKCAFNVADDVDYLAAFLALTNLEIDEVAQIRQKNNSLLLDFKQNLANENIAHGFDVLAKIKNNSYTKTNSELIRYILNEQKLKYFILQKQNGQRELKLIEEFLNQLSVLEDNLGVCEFVDVVQSNISKSGSFEQMDKEESVKILTIHKSKGLEFPVVIMFNTGKTFNTDADTINFNADIGLGVDFFNTAKRTKCFSLTKYAIKLKNSLKSYKEELRLLYVALTRAKNKLIITGQYDDKIFKEEVAKNSYLNMILYGLNINLEDSKQLNKRNFEIVFDDELIVEPPAKQQQKEVEKLYSNFGYDKEKFGISFKNTVTGLNSQKSQDKRFETRVWLKPQMQIDANEDRTAIGTHYHQVLEKLDFAKPYEKPKEFSHFLDVDFNLIELAHKKISPLAAGAINIKHEAEFMMYVPYADVVPSNVKDKVLIQGVVDLIIEHKNSITIVDYKFSKLNINTLKEKYAEQLAIYKMAVEKAFNKKVEQMFIYSITTGELG